MLEVQPFAFGTATLGNATIANLSSDGVQYLVAFETSGVYTLVRSWVNDGNRLLRGDLALYHAKGRPTVEEAPPWSWG